MRSRFLSSPFAETTWDGCQKIACPYTLKGLTKKQDALPASQVLPRKGTMLILEVMSQVFEEIFLFVTSSAMK